MVPKLALFFLFVLSCCSLVFAVPSLTFTESSIRSGETLFGVFSTDGTFTQPLTASQVRFFEGRRELDIAFDSFPFEGKHYLSFYPHKLGNFTVRISSAPYTQGSTVGLAHVEASFEVLNSSIAVLGQSKLLRQSLAVKPGAVFPGKILTLENTGEVGITVTYAGSALPIAPLGQVNLSLSNLSGASSITLDTYRVISIPIIALSSPATMNTSEAFSALSVTPDLIFAHTLANTPYEVTLSLENQANYALRDIRVANTSLGTVLFGEGFVQQDGQFILGEESSGKLLVRILPSREGVINDTLKFSFLEQELSRTFSLPVVLYVLASNGSVTDIEEVTAASCTASGGTVCAQACAEGVSSTFLGQADNYGVCCQGACRIYNTTALADDRFNGDKEEGGSTWVYALLIFAVLGGIGYFLYRKSKTAGGMKAKPSP